MTHRIHVAVLLALLTAFTLVIPVGAQQDSDSRIQVIDNRLESAQQHFYLVKLQAGDTLYAYAQNRSGNLDPTLALLAPEIDPQEIEDQGSELLQQVLTESGDPLTIIPQLLTRFSLAWDDDSGEGYAAALQYPIVRTGTYRLLVIDAQLGVGFGDYRLTLGINAPQVLEGSSNGPRAQIATFDREFSSTNTGAQLYSPTINYDQPQITLEINPLTEGDVLYVHVRTVSGNLRPTLVVRDFGGKAQVSANATGRSTVSALQFRPRGLAEGYTLTLAGCCDISPGDRGTFRVLVGVNTPEVLSGQVQAGGRPPLQLPIEVAIGVRLQQIVNVNQVAENFDAVATLRMEWQDPELAFNPEGCNCDQIVYQENNFNDFLRASNNRWPGFSIFNQQGNRWVQNRVVSVRPDGSAVYLERFSTTLQAPDFDFTRFPFDRQTFYIRVDGLASLNQFYFVDDSRFTAVGQTLGEEEWIVIDSFTEITSETLSSLRPVSRFSFGFNLERHLNYYIFRLFLPVSLIILVSWFVFFIADYSKRVDVASANLLAFIAYNFTIANDLPRLGYLTFMDTFLIATFVISVFTVLYMVALRRLVDSPQGPRIKRIDSVLIWAYPFIYIVTFALLAARVL